MVGAKKKITYRWKKKSRSKTAGKMKLAKSISLNYHNFKFKYYNKNYLDVEMNGTDDPFVLFFTLSALPNYLELQKLFDAYRLNKVKVTLTPRYNSNLIYQTASFTEAGDPGTGNTDAGGTNLLGTSNMGLPSIVTAIDYNDGTMPADFYELFHYQTVKKTLCNKPHIRYLVPRTVIQAKDDSGVASEMEFKPKFIPTDYINVAHRGIKGMVVNVPTLPEQGTSGRPMFFIDLEVEFDLTLKCAK